MLDVKVINTPTYFRTKPCFCLWREKYVQGSTKPQKIPYVRNGQCGINHNFPEDLLSYEEASSQIRPGKIGLGVVLSAVPKVAVIDLDNVIDEDGTLHPLALNVIKRFPKHYRELSTSGNGIHIIGLSNPKVQFNTTIYKTADGAAIDLFSGGARRFIALTGHPVPRRDA